MDTSYVAVGTVIYMITDSLTCRPQEKPRRSGQWSGRAARSRQPSAPAPCQPVMPELATTRGRTAHGLAMTGDSINGGNVTKSLTRPYSAGTRSGPCKSYPNFCFNSVKAGKAPRATIFAKPGRAIWGIPDHWEYRS